MENGLEYDRLGLLHPTRRDVVPPPPPGDHFSRAQPHFVHLRNVVRFLSAFGQFLAL
jgi:hypothetical protein